MIHDFFDTVKRIANLTDEEKKNRLVEIRKNQMLTEAITGHDDIPAGHEIEAMLILGSLIPMDDNENDPATTMAKITALKQEIDKKAHELSKK